MNHAGVSFESDLLLEEMTGTPTGKDESNDVRRPSKELEHLQLAH